VGFIAWGVISGSPIFFSHRWSVFFRVIRLIFSLPSYLTLYKLDPWFHATFF
jgi:hypothetical protein